MALNSAKRRRSQKKNSFFDVKYPEVTANTVGPSFTPNKSKGKQLAVSSEESDVNWSPGLKHIPVEPKGVYRHTRTYIEAIVLIDYSLLARGIEVNDEHSAIIESQYLNSSSEITAFAYMAGTPKDVARKFKEHAWIQRKQPDMVRAQ